MIKTKSKPRPRILNYKKSKGRFSIPFHKIIANIVREHIKWEYRVTTLEVYVPTDIECPECGRIRGAYKTEYTVAFTLNNGVVLDAIDRVDHRQLMCLAAAIKEHPNLDLRIVVYRDREIREGLTLTEWAKKLQIPICIYPDIPDHWMVQITYKKELMKAYTEQ